MKRPSTVKALTAPMAASFVSVGRMIEQTGNVRRRKMVGSGTSLSRLAARKPLRGLARPEGFDPDLRLRGRTDSDKSSLRSVGDPRLILRLRAEAFGSCISQCLLHITCES